MKSVFLCADVKGIGGLDSMSKMLYKGIDVQQSLEQVEEERVLLLYSAWSFLLNGSSSMMMASQSNVRVAPHLEDCKMKMQLNWHHDNRGENGSFPWRAWKGIVRMEASSSNSRIGSRTED